MAQAHSTRTAAASSTNPGMVALKTCGAAALSKVVEKRSAVRAHRSVGPHGSHGSPCRLAV